MTAATYRERLEARLGATGTVLCLGLDPDPAALPERSGRDLAGVEAFSRLLLEAALPHAAAVKPNLAFFEAFGSAGMAALERLRALVPDEVPFVADAKRGDIGSTSAMHAAALFDRLGADAVTVSPYLGAEAIAPLLDRSDRAVYVLCRTSNPGAGELQDLVVAADGDAGWPAEPLYLRVARRVGAWRGPERVGLVVGATAPDELRRVRATAPALPFLVPGIGAQGGDAAAALEAGAAAEGPWATVPGGGVLVNVGRGIAGAARGARDPGAAVAEAAAGWAARLPVLR